MYKKFFLVGQYLATSWIPQKPYILTRTNAFFVLGRLDFLVGAFSFSVILFSSTNCPFSSVTKLFSCISGYPRKKAPFRNRNSGFPFPKFQMGWNKIGMQIETAPWVATEICPLMWQLGCMCVCPMIELISYSIFSIVSMDICVEVGQHKIEG